MSLRPAALLGRGAATAIGEMSAESNGAKVTLEMVPIAIIVVCRNALSALKRTVDSIKAVGDARVLPVIVDGASTDGTPEWLSTQRGWVYYGVSEPDRGIYDAMNKGWAQAPADALILYLGAGDLLYELPTDADIRWPGGEPCALILGDTHVGKQPYRSKWTGEIYLRNTAHHQALLVPKRLSPAPPYDVTLRVYADWDFNLRLFRLGTLARYVKGLRTYAAPGGASWSMDLAEIRQVAGRHGGWAVEFTSLALNGVSRWRRRRRDAASDGTNRFPE